MTAFIVILGQDFSGTMLYILIGVIALISIFALLIAKEMFSSGKKTHSKENNPINSVLQDEVKSEVRKKARKEDKKPEKKEVKEKPKRDFIKEFNNLKKRVKRKKLSGKDYLKEVSKFMRSFFSEVLEIDHEFTYEELEQALAKKRKRFIEFPGKIQELQYGSEVIRKDDVNLIADELYEIVKSFHTDPVQEKKSVWNFFSNKPKKNEKRKDSTVGELEKKFDISVSDGDVKASVEIYNEALKIYSKMPEDEKRKEYPKIHKMYDLLDQK